MVRPFADGIVGDGVLDVPSAPKGRRAGQCPAPTGPFWNTGGHREAVGGGSAARPAIFVKKGALQIFATLLWGYQGCLPSASMLR